MANKTFQTRVQSKIDTSQNWAKATNFVPLKGEICIYSDLHRMKVGDGTTKINDLDFFETVASSTTLGSIKADAKTETDTVPARIDADGKLWVKVPDAPLIVTATNVENNTGTVDYSSSEILAAVSAGREVYLRGSINGITLVFAFGGILQGHVFFYNIFSTGLANGAMLATVEENQVYVNNAGFATSDDLDMFKYQIDPQLLPEVTASDNDKILKVVNGAWSATTAGAATSADKLNTDAGSATNPVYFKDGVPVETTYTLGKSVPSDAKFTDTVTEVDATLTAGGTNPVQGSAIKTYIDEKTAGLTGAMHFQGTVTAIPPTTGTYASGDVVLFGNKEYVYDNSDATKPEKDKWIELGDEGSYALKTELDTKVSKSGDTMSGDLNLAGHNLKIVNSLSLGKTANSTITMDALVNRKTILFSSPPDSTTGLSSTILSNIASPTDNDHAANKKYVDDSIPKSLKNPNSLKFTGGSTATYDGSSEVSVDIPTTLKNPNALTFTGAVTETYDGSAEKTINIPAAITVDDALSATSTNPVQNKAVKAGLDTKINKSGDTFTGTLTFSDTSTSSAFAIDLGKNGCINNAQVIYFYYNENGTDRGFYIEAAPPATDDYYASAQFLGIDGDELVRLHGIAPPKNDGDAANKQYVDTMVKNPINMTTDYYASSATSVPTWATMAKTNDTTQYYVEPGFYSIDLEADGVSFIKILTMPNILNTRLVQEYQWSWHDSGFNIKNYMVNSPGGTIEDLLSINSEEALIEIKNKQASLPKYNTGTDSADNNKFLRIVNGTPAWVALTNVAEEGA